MAWRLWPGPATLVFSQTMANGLASRLPEDVKSLISPAGDIALRSPSHPIVRDVLRLLPAPWSSRWRRVPNTRSPPRPRPCAGSPASRWWSTPDRRNTSSFATVVKIVENRWSIEREGVIDAATLVETASLIILFVCTGNTCRSPMAEAICKVLWRDDSVVRIDQLGRRGFFDPFARGWPLRNGDPAAPTPWNVVRGLGGILENQSQPQGRRRPLPGRPT